MVRAPTKLLSVVGALLFIVLATANGAGYRYGVSDQAFYIPAIVRAADPGAFPRDRAIIDAQARLMVLDEAFGAVVNATRVPVPALFAAGYIASLLLIWAALVRIGDVLYLNRWTGVALAAGFTLRHRITRTSANSLEPYFHPRILAFGICALAVAALLRRQNAVAIALVIAGGIVHPTTALWFAVLIGVALLVSSPALRPLVIVAAVIGGGAGAWALTAGPLRDSLVLIDPEWRQVLASKDSLFPHQWPAAAWLANLGTAALWGWAYWQRRAAGRATPEDTGLVAGGAALVALFLLTLPLVAAGVSFFVELQISRVFWLVDFLATAYVLAAVELRVVRRQAMQWVAAVLVAFSVARGVYLLTIEYPERTLFALNLETSPWHDAMRWLAARPPATHVLADPGHAWKYGTSVRVSAGKDVFHEEVKDSAVAIYSRDVAMRVLDRGRALGNFDELTPERARELATRYDLDLLVTETPMELPRVYGNSRFSIYSLR